MPHIELCSRFEEGYLLDKIDNRRIVDGESTYKALMQFLADYDGYAYEVLTSRQKKDIESACHSNSQDYAVMRAILEELEDTGFSGSCSEYDIACCIEMTYPAGAKRIAKIFCDHIQPEINKLCKSQEGASDAM